MTKDNPNATSKDSPVSNAPKPLEHIKASGALPSKAPTAKKPNWREWKHVPTIYHWQACALSLDINPHQLQFTGGEWMGASPGPERFFKSQSFPNKETQDEFELRQRVLIANLRNPEYFSNAAASNFHQYNKPVLLAEFAHWAANVVQWEGLPPELAAIAKLHEKAKSENSRMSLTNDPADYPKWAKRELWTLVQAATLCVGIEPFELSHIYPYKHPAQIRDEHRRKIWRDMYDNSKTAIRKGTLQWDEPNVLRDSNGNLIKPIAGTLVSPHAYIAWAELKGYEIPSTLVEALRQFNLPVATKQTKEADEHANDATITTDSDGLTKREQQIRAIEAEADKLNFPRLAIPDGGKKKLAAKCKADHSAIFGGGGDPFKEAWQAAVSAKPPRIRMKNHDKYAKGK